MSSLFRTLRSIVEHFLIFLKYLFAPVSVLMRLAKFRVLDHGPVIGNLCTQIHSYLMEEKLGRIPKYRVILYPHFGALFSRRPLFLETSNNYFYKLWNEHFIVISNPIIGFLLKPILSAPWLKICRPNFSEKPGESFYHVAKTYYERFDFLKEEAVLRLPKWDLKKGSDTLKQMGISGDEWFVCFYAREPGYYKEGDFANQGRIRNVDISSYRNALHEISKRGGWCIRIGDSKTDPLPDEIADIPRVVDYPHTPFVSDFMDVFLLSKCRFFLTCSSGISLMPGHFGIPIVMTNVIPLHVAKGLYPNDITILKKYFSSKLDRMLTFREAFAFYITDKVHAYYYDALSLEIIDNSEEEIYEVVREMLDRLDGIFVDQGDYLELQRMVDEIIPQYLFCKNGTGKLGYHFLKKNAGLFLSREHVSS